MSNMWSAHKGVHAKALLKRAKAKKAIDFGAKAVLWEKHDNEYVVNNQWTVKSAKASERYKEDPDSLYGKFPPPIVNKWTKIPSRATEGGDYRATKDDIG